MELQILISKKGTQVVTATNLHQALALPVHKYNSNIAKWLKDTYAFKDDIRQPIDLQDYALRNLKYSKQRDYYLSIELASLIALHSDSTRKAAVARHLKKLRSSEEDTNVWTKDQIIAVLELTKAMGLISCQQSVEKLHLQHFEYNRGSSKQWWKYRADLLGYSVEELKAKMMEIGKQYKGRNLLQMLMTIDQYEIIRMAVIDLFIALGKSQAYASTMGDLAKVFAKEMKIPIWDDRQSSIDFSAHNVNRQLVNEVVDLQRNRLPGPLVKRVLQADRA